MDMIRTNNYIYLLTYWLNTKYHFSILDVMTYDEMKKIILEEFHETEEDILETVYECILELREE